MSGARCALKTLALLAASALGASRIASAQEARIADLTVEEKAVPVRLVGYGIVAGLDGTGDRNVGGRQGGMTVQSVANLLRRFNVEIPAEVLRTRNVAAVLVTAEVSPYLRAGGRFEVHVSSVGDARSLRGGVLWMTPLVSDPNGPALATAQGTLLVSDGDAGLGYRVVNAPVNSGRIPSGGLLEGELARPTFASVGRLVLRDPDLGTAGRIAQAINAAMGANTAKIEDPGAVALDLKGSAEEKAIALGKIRDLRLRPDRKAQIVIDARSGTVVAGGDIAVAEAVVSHNGISLVVGAVETAPTVSNVQMPSDSTAGSARPAGDSTALLAAGSSPSTTNQQPAARSQQPPSVKVAPGTQASKIAEALHALQTPAADVAAIFAALRDAGAITAEVVVR